MTLAAVSTATGLSRRQAVAAAKERSPMVERRVEGTTSEFVVADRRCLYVRRILSVRYGDAVVGAHLGSIE